MKYCPECEQEYTDETLNFCLEDGRRLRDSGTEPPTVISPPAVISNSVGQSAPAYSDSIRTQMLGSSTGYPLAGEPTVLLTQKRQGKTSTILASLFGLALLAAGGFAAYKYFGGTDRDSAVPFQSMKIERVTTNGRATQAAIAPDGKQIVYVINEAGKRSLWLRQVATATDVRITEPESEMNYWGLTFSRDGNFLYFISGGTTVRNRNLYKMPLLGGVPQKLIDDVGSPIGISPDGRQIAFSRSGQQQSMLMIANADGSGERAIATRKGGRSYGTLFAGGIAWSGQGDKIISVSENLGDDGRSHTIVGVSVADGSEHPLTAHKWYLIQRIAPLPDGSGLMMTAAENMNDLQSNQIWHLNYEDGAVRKITNDLNDYRSINLSGDGSLLLSVQEDESANIWVAPGGDAAAAVQIKSVSGKADGRDGIDWISDSQIVYHSTVGSGEGIWSIDIDGKNRKSLTPDDRIAYFPSVSTDSRFITFIAEQAGNRGVWRMNTDGSNAIRLTERGVGNNPVASADFIIYRSNQGLWRMPISGGQAELITADNLHRCAISPDGKYVAGQLDVPGNPAKLGVIAVDGKSPMKVFDAKLKLPGRIKWSADGRYVTYVSQLNAVDDIWGQPIDGGPPKKLTNFQANDIFSFSWSRSNKLVISHGTSTSDVVLIRNTK